MPSGAPASFDALLARARALALPGRRRVLGLTGAPGAGKSTLAGRLVERLGALAVLVPMDGFHLAGVELDRLGRSARKGAPDTFDAAGFVALLRRLRDPAGEVVYAPLFRRDLEEPVGSAVPVGPDVPLVVTEGNYLLLGDGPWAAVRGLLDVAWYVETPRDVRLRRLIARHVAFGRSPDAAQAWALGPDERNAELIETTRPVADATIELL